MKHGFPPVLTVFLCMLLTGFAGAGDLVPVTEELPPFNFTEDDIVKGISVDLLLQAAAEAGLDIVLEDILVLPWARAYEQAREVPDTLIFSMSRTALREDLFQWAGPITSNTLAVFARLGSGIESLEDLEGLTIGTIRDTAPEQLLVENGFSTDSFYRGASFEALIRMLRADRIDVIAYNAHSLRYTMRQIGMDPDQYEPAVVLKQTDLWFGLHRDVDPAIVLRLQEAIDVIKKEGVYDRIVESYVGTLPD